MSIHNDIAVNFPVFNMTFVKVQNVHGCLAPRIPYVDENDLKIEAWKARQRDQARNELFSKIRDTRFAM